MGVTVESHPDRLVMIVRISVVEALVQGDRQDRDACSGPEQGTNRDYGIEMASHELEVSHTIDSTTTRDW